MPAKKILIIEDDSMLIGVLIEILSDEGYEVKGFSGAEAAFEYMNEESEKPDLILTDLVLPNMDGFEIIKNLKESIHLNAIPVIVMSNSAQDEDVEKAIALGAHDFIIKSNVSLDKIVKRVKKTFSEKE